ncbi:MAG TPA: AtpZ/AtpI family protein [Roseiarcus sp.]|nr:AtpZ/AtpI family protein [Roseiarcus sp.]
MAERESGEEEDRVLRARLDRLSGALEAQRKASQPRRDASGEGASSDNFGSAMALGLRVAGEFVGSIAVGCFIGWQADAWLGTKPAFLIAFFFLGVAAGVWGVIRATAPLSRSAPAKDEDKDLGRGG